MHEDSIIWLNLNKKLYNLSSIKKAIEDFKDVCNCKIKESNGYFLITLSLKNKLNDCSIDGEFANYVLALMKNENLV